MASKVHKGKLEIRGFKVLPAIKDLRVHKVPKDIRAIRA